MHDTAVQPIIILVLHREDHVEDPRTDAGGARILQLSEDLNLCSIILGPINPRYPPVMITRRRRGKSHDVMAPKGRVGEGDI